MSSEICKEYREYWVLHQVSHHDIRKLLQVKKTHRNLWLIINSFLSQLWFVSRTYSSFVRICMDLHMLSHHLVALSRFWLALHVNRNIYIYVVLFTYFEKCRFVNTDYVTYIHTYSHSKDKSLNELFANNLSNKSTVKFIKFSLKFITALYSCS